MASQYDANPVTFTKEEGFLVRLENTIEIGNDSLWGSLDTSSYIYQVYDASVGLEAASGWQIGACDDVDFERSQDIETVEIGNVLDSGLIEITSEEINASFSCREWKADVLSLAFGTTYHYVTATSGLIMFGGGCTINSRPVVVRGTNVSCNASAITNLTDGVDYITLTLYDCYAAGDLTLSFRVREDSPIAITMRVKPVDTLTRGERSGNVYIATD